MADRSLPAPDYRGFSLAAWALALGGWAGLAYLVSRTYPTPLPQWLFFVAWVTALTGTAAPFVRYLNRRFARQPAPANVLMRQSLWVAFYGATCAWLQIGRTLSVAIALLLAAALGGIEWFLRMRERSRWQPDADDEPA